MEYPKIYNIEGNLGSPYQVRIISPTTVHVHTSSDETDIPTQKIEKVFVEEYNNHVVRIVDADPAYDDDEDEDNMYSYLPTHIFTNVEQIFIGISPRNATTEYSGGYGPEFDGNTILLCLGGMEYVYIGDRQISKFTAKNKIIDYISPVGNNSVPYPYATDEQGLVYLLIEDVILLKSENSSEPYDEYYEKFSIAGADHPKDFNSHNFAGITRYYVKDSRITKYNKGRWRRCRLTYQPKIIPREFYSYRIRQNRVTREVSVEELQKIMDDFAKSIDVEYLELIDVDASAPASTQ